MGKEDKEITCLFRTGLLVLIFSLIGASILGFFLLIFAGVSTHHYLEFGNCEHHQLTDCWDTCKCFWCIESNTCYDRSFMDICNGSKYINEQCSRNPTSMIILWSLFGTCVLVFPVCSIFFCIIYKIDEFLKKKDKKYEEVSEIYEMKEIKN